MFTLEYPLLTCVLARHALSIISKFLREKKKNEAHSLLDRNKSRKSRELSLGRCQHVSPLALARDYTPSRILPANGADGKLEFRWHGGIENYFKRASTREKEEPFDVPRVHRARERARARERVARY